MDSQLTRRKLLGAGGAFAAGAAAGVPVDAGGAVLYEDGFASDTLSEYDVAFRPYGSPEGTRTGGAISWSPDDEWVLVESPAGGVAVVEPPVKPPETGHVHVRFDVTETNAESHTFALRLVEAEDRWVEFGLAGDGDRFAVVDHDGGGEASYSELGPDDPRTGRHAVDVFWSPDGRAVYYDGEFDNSSRPDEPYDFAPRSLLFRNVQANARLRYWRLDERDPPGGTDDLATPTTPSRSRATEPRTPPPTPTAADPTSVTSAAPSAESTSAQTADDWLSGGTRLLAAAVGVPFAGSTVLGGLLLADHLVPDGEDAE